MRKDIEEMKTTGVTEDTFRFFMMFAHETMDRYGRFLGFINRDQLDPKKPGSSYNERLLKSGHVLPYFI